jgi:protein-tyrosine kinase
MSQFFKALEQAERDRALAQQGRSAVPAPSEPEPPADVMEPVDVPLVAAVEAPPEAPTAPAPPPPPPPTLVAPPVASPFTRSVERPAERPVERPVERPTERPAERPARRAVAFRAEAQPVDGDASSGVDEHMVSLLTPTTYEAEQYRGLRHTIEQLHATTGLAVIAVSSPSVGDGKTTTAINLAGSLAQAPDYRVLLIDADLRRPSVGVELALDEPAGPGLVGAIVNPSLTLADVVRRRPPFNLSILPAGRPPTAPYEVLKSPRLTELLAEARRRYDYIILDTPPLVAVPDCRVIAQAVDGFLLVVTAHRTPRKLVEEALNVIDQGKIIGLVFNRDDRPLAGYSDYAYGEYATTQNAGGGRGRRAWRRETTAR